MKNDWCSTHAVFVIIQACAHFMKMHSYVTVNRYSITDVEIIDNNMNKQLKREDQLDRITLII